MKSYKLLISLLFLSFLFVANLFAQDFKDMTEEQWMSEMNSLKVKKENLLKEKDALTAAISDLKKTTPELVEKCHDEILQIVGATKGDVDAFRIKVNELDSKIKSRQPKKADRQAELDELKKNKISALIEFFDKVHNQMQGSLDNWVEEKPENLYTVVKGDHLWKISGKKDIFNNSWAWPKLYQSNKEVIGNNPDLIYAKQTYKVPEINEEETTKYDKMRKVWKVSQKAKAAEEKAATEKK